MASTIHFGYFNYENGGILNPEDGPNGPFRYDYSGLVRVVGEGDAWPDILIMGEGYCYKEKRNKAARKAASVMRKASGRKYKALVGTLPRNWSMAPPVVFVDERVVTIKRWHQPADADFASHKRNLLEAIWKDSGMPFQVIAIHGDTDDGDMRLADAKKLRRYAESKTRCLVAGDWYCVPSGPKWEPRDLDDATVYDRRSSHVGRIEWEHKKDPGKLYKPETRALDFLLGHWVEDEQYGDWGRREECIGFYDVAELARDATPTQYRDPNLEGQTQALCYDRFLVNKEWSTGIVRGSYRVRPPLQPCHPSDHLMVDVTMEAV